MVGASVHDIHDLDDSAAGVSDESCMSGYDIEDLEAEFDAVGIATCVKCGVKLPLDQDAIDRHSKECKLRWLDRMDLDGMNARARAHDMKRSRSFEEVSTAEGASVSGEHNQEDWEDGLDAIGVAKCVRCGLRLPLDDDAVERHSKECRGVERQEDLAEGPRFGNCCRCGLRIPQDFDSIVAHSHVCPALARGGAKDAKRWFPW